MSVTDGLCTGTDAKIVDIDLSGTDAANIIEDGKQFARVVRKKKLRKVKKSKKSKDKTDKTDIDDEKGKNDNEN